MDWVGARWFRFVHSHNLVYNTCWEDPRLDRVALGLSAGDRLLAITSAGCNVLDYALLGPQHIHAVDLNPRQNALLELKLAAIRHLDFDTFFEMFGRGRLPDYREAYQDVLRGDLSPTAQVYWDRHINFFSGRGWRTSFYFHGTSGIVARLVNTYIDRFVRVRDAVERILEAACVEEQRQIYDARLRDVFWSRTLRFMLGRDTTLSLVGVPRQQRRHLEDEYQGGVVRFVEDCLEAVFTCLPLRDNYFWRVYLTGQYTPECCPEYLRRENFERLKSGLAERISVHTTSVLDFLTNYQGQISRFVLLDHMDWLATVAPGVLKSQWQAIIDRSAPQARVIWRSGGLHSRFVDAVEVRSNGQLCRVGDVLRYHRSLADALHARDRVHTYGSFHIADLSPA